MTHNTKCPHETRFQQMLSDGPDTAMREHLQNCSVCATRWEKARQQAKVLAAMPIDLPDELHRAEMRKALMKQAQKKLAKQRRTRVVRYKALAVAAGIVFVASPLLYQYVAKPKQKSLVAKAQIHRAKIFAQKGAQYHLVSSQPDEIIRLYSGTITVQVEHLQKNERCRVLTGDAEVEVRGTGFDLVAEHDSLKSVRVFHGLVAVRVQNQHELLLKRGERWQQPPPANEPVLATQIREAVAIQEADKPSATAKKRKLAWLGTQKKAAKVKTDAAVKKATIAANAQDLEVSGNDSASPKTNSIVNENGDAVLPLVQNEADFRRAWSALQDGDAPLAEQIFLRLEHDPNLGEEARFWRGVSLAQSGKTAQSVQCFMAFMNDFPKSSHLAEAQLALGWQVLQQGQYERARVYFLRARDGPDAHIRSRAERGLKRIEFLQNKEN